MLFVEGDIRLGFILLGSVQVRIGKILFSQPSDPPTIHLPPGECYIDDDFEDKGIIKGRGEITVITDSPQFQTRAGLVTNRDVKSLRRKL